MFTTSSARLRARLCAGIAVAASAVGLAVGAAVPATAAALQATLVSTVPMATTPNIDDGVVYAIARVGNYVVVGGSFTGAKSRGVDYPRNYLLAFDATSGALVQSFDPEPDGIVRSLQPGPDGNSVYVGGAFTHIAGVTAKHVALLSLGGGQPVAGFTATGNNGVVWGMRVVNGHLLIVGTFTAVGGAVHDGIASISATTGKPDGYVNVQLTGHHNYNGTGADGPVGGRALDVSPDGTTAVVIGNFKQADGVTHDQVVMLSLDAGAATIDSAWNTQGFTAACASAGFDTYVEDVSFAPDGSYFAIAATGGGGPNSLNTDGTRSLCDTATRWETNATGDDVAPTWIDRTGNDTFWSIAATGAAIYVGGHQRWVNNPDGNDVAGPGAVPRPGIVALDPVNGLPFSWNPGRNPRGKGAYALLATADGLYVGSDTDYIGNRQYFHGKIAFFPMTGGETPPAMTTATLAGNLFQAGVQVTTTTTGGGKKGKGHVTTTTSFSDTLQYTPADASGHATATPSAVTNPVQWGTTRGAFLVGGELYWPALDGNLYEASFDGSTVGTPAVLDAYDDPIWSSVSTGSGQTYQGVKPTYYNEVSSITGQFYWDGRIYYSLVGKPGLYYRYFELDDGVIGETEFSAPTSVDFSAVDGMTISGDTIYYADKTSGALQSVAFNSGSPSGPVTTVDSSVDWRATNLFISDN